MATIQNTPAPVCPYGFTAASAAAPAAAAPPSEAHTGVADTLADPRAETIPCPFWRTVINENLVHLDKDGNASVSEMRHALSAIGARTVLREAAILGVKHALGPISGVSGALATLNLDHINIYDLRHGPLMHNGDTGILRDGFNQAKLDTLLNHSSDGVNLSLSDLAKAQIDQLAADPGEQGHKFGAAELSLLITAFGEKNEAGDKFLSKKDLTTLYKDNKFPEGWQKRAWGGLAMGTNIVHFFDEQKKAKKSEGACPFLQGSPFCADEAAKKHAEMVPQ